jgi:hypothetical protein
MAKGLIHAPEGPGLRAGIGGPVLSSGSSDLDQLCGGGLSLSSLVVVFEVHLLQLHDFPPSLCEFSGMVGSS